jgi:phosphatidylglycerophosphate synthase
MNPSLDRIVILADESANWKIAGLRQLDQLVLAVNEFAKSMIGESKIDIFIFWRPDVAIEKRWRPSDPRLTRCNILEFSESALPGACVLNTRLLVKRSGLETFLHDSVSIDLDHSIVNESALWEKLWRQFENIFQEAQAQQKRESWRYVRHRSDIPCCERWLLRGSGKSRDGFVSRYLNRPISRAVSQLLLKTPMTPNVWTLLITLFPLIGFLFLIRGDYFGFVVGAALYQVHSILDGCDGEIARAKYLDSEKGPGIDAIGDLISLLLFSIGLGGGLFRSAQPHAVSRWVFLSEGILTFVFLALRLGPDHVLDLFRRGPAAVAFSKNDERLQRSGGQIFGARFTSWGFELTKRDVVFFAFLIAAVLGLARWILHLLFIYALVTLILSWRGRAGRETMA